jgi:arylsulfatase A-like enzyme
MGALKRLGYYNNTMIWFTTDNGPEVNCAPEGRCGSGKGLFVFNRFSSVQLCFHSRIYLGASWTLELLNLWTCGLVDSWTRGLESLTLDSVSQLSG